MSHEILNQNLVSGVDYYNKEKQKIIKDNILVSGPDTSTKENEFSSFLSGLEADASLSPSATGDAVSKPVVGNPAEDFALNEDMIVRAPIQLWDNGEKSFRRYKIKVRLNLKDDDENPEFIASLTKDFRNFKRYIPEECRDHIIEQATDIRAAIKQKHGTYPYLGKFHLANVYQKGRRVTNQIEPWSLAAVWWDPEERGWSGLLCIHNWAYQFDLFEENLTAKQKAAGCKASTLYINPKHDERQRPKTWAQRRNQGEQQ
jgi:hypothetical protein